MAKNSALVFMLLLSVAALAVVWKAHTNGPKPTNRHTADWACLNNLRLIDSSKQQWAEEQHKGSNDSPAWSDVRPYCGRGSNGELPECPFHGIYTLGRAGEKTRCSIHGTVPGQDAP
jgi:hypothetical protein